MILYLKKNRVILYICFGKTRILIEKVISKETSQKEN